MDIHQLLMKALIIWKMDIKLNVLNVVGEEELQKKPTTRLVFDPLTGELK